MENVNANSADDTIQKEPPIPIAGYITDLPEDKVRKLKPEDLERMITLKMASEGIQIVEKPTEPTYHEIPEKDVTLYAMTGLKYAFTKMEDAQKAASVLIPLAMHMRGNEWFSEDTVEKITLKEYGDEPFTITPKKAYSQALWSQIAKAKQENKEMKDRYDKKLKEYEAAHNDANWIRSEVMDKYYEVQRKYEEMDRLVIQYETYLDVAEGNDDFAWKFLKKAYRIDAGTEEYIRKKITDMPKKK